ncbi:MAG: glycosyltransferase [Pseudomonadota bacterium]|nr:glycosyltransferase [Pseudomonadota bacterium]
MRNDRRLVDFEFTLALNNATGKFFVCQDAIEACNDLIRNVWYWRLPMKTPPPRAVAKVLGRLALLELNFRIESRSSRFMPPLMRNPRPLVFTDPREVILYELKRCDVVLCHDVGPITHSDLYHPLVKFTYETAFRKIYKAKPLLVFVSKSSMTNFVNLYGDDYPSMNLIYPALRGGVESGPEESIEAAPQHFLLTVGSIGSRKNQLRSIEAFAQSKLADEGYCYVVCGGPEPGFDAVVEAAGKTHAVILPGYVNDNQLRWLYTHASGFVLPSLLEGFGLPAAEAIFRGLVPLLGRGEALHEVAGDSAILVDPLNMDEIADGMRLLAHMGQEDRQARLSELRQSIARFSRNSAEAAWRSTLQQALAQ